METRSLDSSKRKFFFTGALALAGSLLGCAQAKDGEEERVESLEARLEAKIADYDLQIERLKALSAVQMNGRSGT